MESPFDPIIESSGGPVSEPELESIIESVNFFEMFFHMVAEIFATVGIHLLDLINSAL